MEDFTRISHVGGRYARSDLQRTDEDVGFHSSTQPTGFIDSLRYKIVYIQTYVKIY